MIPARHSTIWDTSSLIPEAWAGRVGDGWRAFNPSVLPDDRGGYVMTYRVVTPKLGRKIAMCRLDASLAIVPGSVTAFSDIITFSPNVPYRQVTLDWHADPRLFSLDGQSYIYWNDGNIDHNNQFLMPFDLATLRPTGLPVRLNLAAKRRNVEKNWGLFFEDGIKAVYAADPQRIIALTKQEGEEASFADTASGPELPAMAAIGEMRGGAAPMLHEGEWYSFGHICRKTNGKRYYEGAVYTYRAGEPEKVVQTPTRELTLPNPFGGKFVYKPLNMYAGEVLYICGALRVPGGWLITYGINDEHSAAYMMPDEDLKNYLAPISQERPSMVTNTLPAEAKAQAAKPGRVPTYFWDAAKASKKFQTGNFGDLIGPAFIESLSGHEAKLAEAPGQTRRLITVGSILHRAGQGDVVWGTGLKGSTPKLGDGVTELDVRAVRGPITLDFLRRRGIDTSRVTQLFDPGSLIAALMPEVLEEAKKLPKKPFAIVPHFNDLPIFQAKRPDLADAMISPDGTVAGVAAQIISAERVISSSLHGIIVAEAFGVPAIWLAPAGGEDELKYYDYYLGTGRYTVRRASKLDMALKMEPMPLPKLDIEAMKASFPHDAIQSLLVND